jgi:hypothetical protein
MEPLNLKTHHVASYNPDVSIWVVDGKLQARSEFLETECAEECVTGSKRLYQSIGLTDAEAELSTEYICLPITTPVPIA